MSTTTQTRQQAVEMILSVLRDGQRIDRYLRRADDGHYYTTPDKTYLTDRGPETPPYVAIPWADSTVSDDDAEEWAAALLAEAEAAADA